MFLLLFVQLNEQKNNKMQTLRWMLLYCCLQEGQGRVPLSGHLPMGLKGSTEPRTWSHMGSGFALGADRAQSSLCSGAATEPNAAGQCRCREVGFAARTLPHRASRDALLTLSSSGCVAGVQPPLLGTELGVPAAGGTVGGAPTESARH